MEKNVYNFKNASHLSKALLGGKGSGLAEMTRIGLPVPNGFTITTKACQQFYKKEKKLWTELKSEIMEELTQLERNTGKKIGDAMNPLLVSVRSGAAISMPGMMDTVLNLGLNDVTVMGLAHKTNNSRFAYDSYRRFIQMFSDVVMGIPKYKFERIIESIKTEKKVTSDLDLTEDDLLNCVMRFKSVYKSEIGKEFPNDPLEQLFLTIEAVFQSWNNSRAIIYRNLHEISHDIGTAVNVQTMVFGNMGKTSGTGVCFTRNPSTGENKVFGEYLINAQGEDVVAGIRTPQSLNQLKNEMPVVYEELIHVAQLLEDNYQDMQDIEFTIEEGKLFLLQTRVGKRTANAAIKIAVELVEEKKISKQVAILRIKPEYLEHILHPCFDEKEIKKVESLGKGLPASPGASSGKVYFHAEDVLEASKRGEDAILVRQETSPEDIEGMVYAQGILTSRGGMTSHAAVVCRGMGKCCIVGCTDIKVNETLKQFSVGNQVIKEGEEISLDGGTGHIYLGSLHKIKMNLTNEYHTLVKWMDEIRELKIRTNADTPQDAQTAIKLGAEGIGLCRTEHMFFEKTKITEVRKMILAQTLEEREKALLNLKAMQKKDFIDIFDVLDGLPCTIRLLDPPLHEFLPTKKEEIKELAILMKVSDEELEKRIEQLQEVNPMLGHRGCRLAITYPEIYVMQAGAIIEAAIELKRKDKSVTPEIMIPLVSDVKEFIYIKEIIVNKIKEIFKDEKLVVNYQLGTMIEVPRIALLADEIAGVADFFSFGTNDLTQMTYGFSRDDSHKFINEYKNKTIFEQDPFQRLDQKGVGKLMKYAAKLGKQTNKNIKMGICGEHGGDPSSIIFCQELGLDYVSCSPYRVPLAKLASTQAVIHQQKGE